MPELKETWGFQKLCEVGSKSPTNNAKESTMGIIKEQLERGYFDMYEPELIDAFQSMGGDADTFLGNIKQIPFRHFFDQKHGKIKEFLASSGTTGIAGAYYLIPVKLYTELQTYAYEQDIVAQISKAMLGPDAVSPGTTMKIDVMVDGQYKSKQFSPGGIIPTESMETKQVTFDFTPVYGFNIRITNDLVEDSQFELIQMHVQKAGESCGEKASDLALTVLGTGTDGDGTINGGASGNADETKFTGATTNDYMTLYRDICDDRWHPTTIISHRHAMIHSVISTTLVSSGSYSEPWAYNIITNGLPTKMLGCDVIYGNWPILSASTLGGDGAGNPAEGCITLMLDKTAALLSGRKRWLRVENYSEPVKDLVGATVTFRQDSVSLYNDAAGIIYETN